MRTRMLGCLQTKPFNMPHLASFVNRRVALGSLLTGVFILFYCVYTTRVKTTIGPKNVLQEEGLVNLLEAAIQALPSNEYSLKAKANLLRTLRYMSEEREEYDEELVAFVRSLIVSPPLPKLKRPLLNETALNMTDFSQFGQSRRIDEMLSRQRDGYFIECGGYDGEVFSNSLFFELERNWTGEILFMNGN